MKNLSVVVVGMLAGGVALGQGDVENKDFGALDTNIDGKISVMEASANQVVLERFNELDSNGDGLLTRQEFSAFYKQE